MILSAQSIRAIPNLVTPFVERTVHEESGMSYGLGNCGYDLTIGSFRTPLATHWMLEPGDFICVSVEQYTKFPADICGFIKDKSTWARRGLAVQNTVAEPGWEGYLTLELSNHGKQDLLLNIGMPICQLMFQWLDKATDSPYKGKYQNQPARPVEAMKEGETF